MMNADKPEVFEYVDSNFAGFIVDKFCRLRENGLFLDVTLKVNRRRHSGITSTGRCLYARI